MTSFSPSDLEADLEDNQDYDSTVSQSETNLSLVGQLSPVPPPTNTKMVGRCSPDSMPAKPSSQREDLYSRPVSYPSRFRDQDADIENLNLGSLRLRDGRSEYHHREPHSSPKSMHRMLRTSSQESYEPRPIINTRARELEKVWLN